jgi:hypothetical protein
VLCCVVQTLHAPEPADRLLIGVLRVLRTVVKRKALSAEPDALLALTRLVYTHCLFAIPSETSAGSICKSHASRSAAYALLMEMAEGIPVSALSPSPFPLLSLLLPSPFLCVVLRLMFALICLGVLL